MRRARVEGLEAGRLTRHARHGLSGREKHKKEMKQKWHDIWNRKRRCLDRRIRHRVRRINAVSGRVRPS